ncbi:hypothetical protein ASF27_11915 [Methylobacterium sp. Leaf102]|uniref:hypothetical protein n=1 Tax=Methylobacterium sp. Leaf102 TaxID=1736253 RepID=UPI0006FCF3EF|nr:hypothetical protein [Methylobacterium sp. Leaf102]KQP23868.1 hypothetical protein ASF27_11915 [Methylobacterium sp. Leaf102]
MCDLITDLQRLGIAQVRARLTQARTIAQALIDDPALPEIRRERLAVALDEMDACLLDYAKNALFHLAGEIEQAGEPIEERVDLDALRSPEERAAVVEILDELLADDGPSPDPVASGMPRPLPPPPLPPGARGAPARI